MLCLWPRLLPLSLFVPERPFPLPLQALAPDGPFHHLPLKGTFHSLPFPTLDGLPCSLPPALSIPPLTPINYLPYTISNKTFKDTGIHSEEEEEEAYICTNRKTTSTRLQHL